MWLYKLCVVLEFWAPCTFLLKQKKKSTFFFLNTFYEEESLLRHPPSLPGAQYVRNRCYQHSRFKSWNVPAIQVQALNGLVQLNSFGCKWSKRENWRSVWRPLRHSKAWTWAELVSSVKLVGVLQLGVLSEPRDWHFWGRNSFSSKCQWETLLNVHLT